MAAKSKHRTRHEGPVPLKKFGKRENCKKYSTPHRVAGGLTTRHLFVVQTRPSYKKWIKMAGQIHRGADHLVAPQSDNFELKTDRYNFFETVIFEKFFHTIFSQLPIFDWPPILIFQKLLTDISADILKYFG